MALIVAAVIATQNVCADELLRGVGELVSEDAQIPAGKLTRGLMWVCKRCGYHNVLAYVPATGHVGAQCARCGLRVRIKAAVSKNYVCECPHCRARRNLGAPVEGVYQCASCNKTYSLLSDKRRAQLAASERELQFDGIAQTIAQTIATASVVVCVLPFETPGTISMEQQKKLGEYVALRFEEALFHNIRRYAPSARLLSRLHVRERLEELKRARAYGDVVSQKELGRELNADIMVTGRIMINPNKVRVHCTVLDCETGEIRLVQSVDMVQNAYVRGLIAEQP